MVDQLNDWLRGQFGWLDLCVCVWLCVCVCMCVCVCVQACVCMSECVYLHRFCHNYRVGWLNDRMICWLVCWLIDWLSVADEWPLLLACSSQVPACLPSSCVMTTAVWMRQLCATVWRTVAWARMNCTVVSDDFVILTWTGYIWLKPSVFY